MAARVGVPSSRPAKRCSQWRKTPLLWGMRYFAWLGRLNGHFLLLTSNGSPQKAHPSLESSAGSHVEKDPRRGEFQWGQLRARLPCVSDLDNSLRATRPPFFTDDSTRGPPNTCRSTTSSFPCGRHNQAVHINSITALVPELVRCLHV